MPKNKSICGVVCKPTHKGQNRRDNGNDPFIKFPIRLGVMNFLFFQIFACLAILMIPTNVWAALTSMSVDGSGDLIFRGGSDRLLITFTVDDRTDDDGDPYTVTAGGGLVAQGVVLPNETIRIIWDGSINGQQLLDGTYEIKVVLNRQKREDEVEDDLARMATATIDATPPVISSIVANDTPITEGSFVNTPISSITVTSDQGEGSPIDFGRNLSNIVLKNEQGTTVSGSVTQIGNQLTFTLGNPLDAPSENGTYTLEVRLTDSARNTLESETKFAFDNVPPALVSVTTSRGALTPGAGVNLRLGYVEATLTDNLANGLNLLASRIRLTGPNGTTVLGRQTQSSSNRIRWRFLSPLESTEGLQDGEYTIAVVGVDKAGNQTEPVEVSFLYDNVAPRLVSLSPAQEGTSFNVIGDTIYSNLPITEFVAAFDDGESGIGVNLVSGPQKPHIVFGTPKADEGINMLPGHSFPNSDPGSNSYTLTHVLENPISSRDGSQDGRYILNILAIDTLGNTRAYNYQFIYDTQFPTLVSTMPAANETVSDLSKVEVQLDEETSGIDFIQSNFRLIRDGIEVPVNVTSSVTGTATLTLAKLIALDGSDDGTYTIEVTPTDRAGNTGATALRNFYLVSQKHEPEIRLVMPESTRVNGLLTVAAQLDNYIGAGIDFDASTVTVKNAQGALISQEELEHDAVNNLLTWTAAVPVVRDGSADGAYIVTATFIDFTGRHFTQEFSIVLDTQVPALISTVPAANETVSRLSQVEVKLSEEVSGIDFLQSTFRLTRFDETAFDETADGGENGGDEEQTRGGGGVQVNVPVNIVSNGTDTVILTLAKPIALDGSDDGTYAIEVTPTDRAGNIGVTVIREFYLVSQRHEPEIRLLMPAATRVSDLTTITVELIDYLGAGIDFNASTVVVRNVQGALVPQEELERDAVNNLLTWTAAVPVARDGSVDGEYVVTATFVDFTGRRFTQEFPVVVDTRFPTVESVRMAAESKTYPAEDRTVYITKPFVQVTVVFDASSNDVDFEATLVSLVGPDGTNIPINRINDGQTVLTISSQALTEDGEYVLSITPRDRVGNAGSIIYRKFVYDTQEPRITEPTPLVLNQQPVTYISGALRQFQFAFTIEDVGPAGLFLEEQSVEVLNTSGANIPVAVTRDELTSQIYLGLPASLPRDGSADGEYTAKISLVDKAGNRSDSEHTLVYDSKIPRLASVMVNTDPPMELVPNRIAEILASISSITLQFEEATRIDFTNTAITLMGPESSNASGESTTSTIPLTLEDDGVSQVTISFLELEQIGTYTLSVTPRDVAGNAATGAVNYTFILDIPLPRVSSVIIGESETTGSGDVAYVNASNMVIGAILLDPTETGLSFGSERSDITVTESDGTTIVPGGTDSNGEDLIVWEPITLTSDGTTDGRYNVYVTPIDKAGRQGSTVYREFIYDTQDPEIIAADPIDLSQPVSYISRSLTQLSFTVADMGPADLELSDQKVTLRDASGSLVPSQLTDDTENQLFLTLNQPLPLNGSMDGEYTVLIELADKAGNSYTVEHLIIYDTQAPTLASTVPTDGALLREDVTQIQVTLNDEGGSGIDWAMTTVTLVDPSGTQISGELVSNGTTGLTLTTNQLVEDGRYIIRVKAVDRAGNGDATVFERSFLLSRQLPTIVSTEPSTAPADEAFANEELDQIEVMIETDDENHLSTLRLLNRATQVVSGQQERRSNRLIYNLVRPLATDGSEDGVYTIEFTPISASGRSGEVQRLTFTYDTQAPEIETDDAISLVVAQPEVNNSLTEIRVNLTDETSGIDWENLDEEWLTFERLSPNPTEISGRISEDGEGNLTFRLTVPLADNGSADGEYRITVNPKDRADNDDEPYERVFIYDTSPPMIDSGTLLINEAPLLVDINAVNYPTAVSTTGGVVIQANIFDTGLGTNLAQSKIVVRSPDGSEISGNTQQNGVDTLIFKSEGLRLQGVYQVSVTSIGNDSELLGFAPTDSLTTEFLYEMTVPTAAVTSDGGETELTDEALPLEGTASDPSGTERIGEDEITVPASGVWLVEIVGTGPDNQPIDPVRAVDDSNAEQEPWSIWSIDFLPTRSGEYDLDVRVTDNAGNYEVYDIGEYTMSVSLTFRGTTFGWPNPLRLSKRDVAFFSFDVNVPLGETIELTLSIYDWSGDMVLSQTYPDVVSGQRNDQLVKWNLENQAGTPVARGLYIFRLEAVNTAGNSANVVGKVLVVD